jgi:GNAT superfamily N-acetyltransferase
VTATKGEEESGAVEFHPVTQERWQDFEALFGKSGAYGGCWCMWWRLSRAEFGALPAAERKGRMRSIVQSGEVPGVLAYVDGEPAGWCSVAPRERFGGLERSRTLKRVDDKPVWSVVCFFVSRPYRGRGLMPRLLRAAAAYAAGRGARIVEGYPVEADRKVPGGTKAYVGIASAFREAGFVEVDRRGPDRRIMRYFIGGGARS